VSRKYVRINAIEKERREEHRGKKGEGKVPIPTGPDSPVKRR
jgi:hypothetical protein